MNLAVNQRQFRDKKIIMSNKLLKALAVFTAVTTVMSLSGVMLAPRASAVAPGDYGLKEGDVVSAVGSSDPDIYIVNDWGYKRLFLNPVIFNFYGHIGWDKVKSVAASTRDAFGTSGLFRKDGDEKVYGVEVTGEDTGTLHWVNMSGAAAVAEDANFFKKVFVINDNEFNWYSKSAVDYTALSQIPVYTRGGATPTPTPTGPLSVSLAPDNTAGQTITQNAVGVNFLKIRFSGTGTVNSVTLKRLGAGETDDFSNVYVYDGAKRLTSGKSFSSATGEVTFINLGIAVSGTKDITIVADMSGSVLNEAGNVNYLQLTTVDAGSGVSVSGLPVSGNNFTNAGTSSGTVDTARVGIISNPNVGQAGAQLSEFKLTATNEWAGSVTTDSYLVFDLGSGFKIEKGGNATFKIYGDVAGKKSETVILYFENDSDLLAVGDQYGQGMAEGTNTLDSSTSTEAFNLTLQGGVLTITNSNLSAHNIGTIVTDTTLLRYTMLAATNLEVRKTEFTLCSDDDGSGVFDDTDTGEVQADWDDLTDFKVWNEDTGTIVMGPKDGTAFNDAEDSNASCGGLADGAQEIFTDTLDLAAGKVYSLKVTADINTSNGAAHADELVAGDAIKVVLDDYSDDAGSSGDVTILKYSGTNTAVVNTDIVPNADITGPVVTLQAASLTLGLASSPTDQTQITGTKNVDVVGITFAAAQASALTVSTIKLTGYISEGVGAAVSNTFNDGVDPNDTGSSVGNAGTHVRLYASETGALVGGSGNITSNNLSTNNDGSITFSNLNWNLPAGATKTLLVRVDASTNTVSGSEGDRYAFDIVATSDVSAVDSSNNTVNASAASVLPNAGTTAPPTQILTLKNSGTMSLATAADSPVKGAVYWGQQNAPISKFRLSSVDEAQYIEKLTIGASNSSENTSAAANVKHVILTYKNKAGNTLTTTQAFGQGASANFAWESPVAGQEGTSTDLRPYVPKDSSLDIAVNANMKTKTEGATQDSSSAVFFSLDLLDRFNGSFTNGFKAVGEGSGTVIDGTASSSVSSIRLDDVLGANDQYVYRVFPKIEQIALSSPYNLTGNPTVFKL